LAVWVDCRLSHCRPARHCESVPRRPPFVNHSDRLRSSPTSYNRFISLWHIQKRHPLRDETSTDETTPKPDRPRPHLGRNRVLAYGPVTFPHSGVSRMSASVRLMIQGHSARRASSRVRQCHLLIKISEIKSHIRRCSHSRRTISSSSSSGSRAHSNSFDRLPFGCPSDSKSQPIFS
jgi:hypothetical protein